MKTVPLMAGSPSNVWASCLRQYLSFRYRRSPVVLDRVFEIHTWLANVGSHDRAVTHGDVGKWSVGDVQLRDEASELWLTGQGASDVRVVWSDLLSWSLPLKEDVTSWIREWDRAVVRDGGITVVSLPLMVVARISVGGLTRWGSWSESNCLVESSSVGVPSVDVRLVEDSQLREVLPCETLAVRWARADVRREISPSPRLWNTGLEPNWHWEQAGHLSEQELLTGLGGDGLVEHLCDLAGIQVGLETEDTGLAPASEDLGEVEGLVEGLEWVVVGTHWSGATWSSKHVGEEGGVSGLLVGHELDEIHIRLGEVQLGKVGLVESGENVVKEIQLDPLLVETEKDRLVVEVGLNAVHWLGSVSSKTAGWLKWNWLRVVEGAVRIVQNWVWWRDWNGGVQRLISDGSSNGWGARVWSIAVGHSSRYDWLGSKGVSWDGLNRDAGVRGLGRETCRVDRWLLVVRI